VTGAASGQEERQDRKTVVGTARPIPFDVNVWAVTPGMSGDGALLHQGDRGHPWVSGSGRKEGRR
jgi:hypothetical protein